MTTVSTVAVAALLLTSVGQSWADDASSGWTCRPTPYLWLPPTDGSLQYVLPTGSGGSPEVSVGPADWLELLNAGLRANGSASKGRFSTHSDLSFSGPGFVAVFRFDRAAMSI